MRTKLIQVSVTAYAVSDIHGRVLYDVAVDPSDTLFICGLVGTNGSVTFEAEAYHLEQWCNENGLVLTKTRINKTISADIREV